MKWRQINDWRYEISETGLVRNRRTHKLLHGSPDHKGYIQVELHKRLYMVHRLVLAAFVGPCPSGKEANHKDGDKRNNRLENLEWVSASANMLHAYRILGKPPVCNPKRLTAEKVRQIRKAWPTAQSKAELARQYGVCRATIRHVIRGHTWRHALDK